MAYVQKNSPFKQVEDGAMIPKKQEPKKKTDVSTKSSKTTYGDPFLDQKPLEDPKTTETTEKRKDLGDLETEPRRKTTPKREPIKPKKKQEPIPPPQKKPQMPTPPKSRRGLGDLETEPVKKTVPKGEFIKPKKKDKKPY